MASNGDLADMEYLSPSFEPMSLTVPRLRSIFVEHNISFPASAKKSQLVDIFTRELVPRARTILAARERVRRTSRGITDMPSSQEGTANGAENDDDSSMPPPPPPSTKRKSRKSSRIPFDDGDSGTSGGTTSSSTKRSHKHPRSSDPGIDQGLDRRGSSARRKQKSLNTPLLKREELEDPAIQPSTRSSAFSDDNPFQSGSSPLAAIQNRRKSAISGADRRKSFSRRRKTEGIPSSGESSAKQEDGIVAPSTTKTFSVSASNVRNASMKQEQDDAVEAGEEFTPEETLELVEERTKSDEKGILYPNKKRARRSGLVPNSAPWVILTSLLFGYVLWFRQEKVQVGYCGIGRPSMALSDMQFPEWVSSLQPTCEPCPPHAYCYESLQTKCEKDFILRPHPLSLGGIVPLPPMCEPDGEKVRRVRAVADRAVEHLRDQNAKWECGTLRDENGKSVPTVEVDIQDLKSAVARKKRKGMSEEEFEDLWKEAIGEVMTRDEVVTQG